MMYGKLINGQLIRVSSKIDEAKELVYTNTPVSNSDSIGFIHEWVDKGEYIEQVWTECEIDIDEQYKSEISDSEALAIILGGESV